MSEERRSTGSQDPTDANAMTLRYKAAVERAIPHLPVKNGVVDIDSIWVETSLPFDLLRDLLKRPDLELPENVDRINTKSRVQGGPRRVNSRRRRDH
jgi:hypothetical protein